MSEKFPKIHTLGSQIDRGSLDNSELYKQADIKEVFRLYPALAEIGSADQYLQYLNTIFPGSVQKEIFWHATLAKNKDSILQNGFDPRAERNFDTLNSIESVFNFSTNREFISRYGDTSIPVVLNIKNPIEDSSTGEYANDLDRPLSEALFKMGKRAEQQFAPSYDESLKDRDAFINKVSGEYYRIASRTGIEIGVPRQLAVAVFNPNQVHILGSQADIGKFKEFVSERNSD